MKIFRYTLLALAVLGVIAFLVVGRLREEVPVARAEQGTAVDAVTGTIEVKAEIDLSLKTELNGRVREVPVEPGDTVQEGDVIAILDSADLRFELEQHQIRLEIARERNDLPVREEFELANLREAVEALELSVERGVAARQELDRTRRNLEQLEAAVRGERLSRRESVALLELRVAHLRDELERTYIRTPYDGRVVEQHAFAGDWLWSGDRVARIVSPDRTVEMTLSEEDYFGVEPGQRATLRLASFPGQTFEGEVQTLGLTADPESKTRKVFLSVDESAETLVPGLSGEGVLVKREREGATIIPRRGLIGQNVFVLVDDRVEIRRVTPGFLSLDKAEIREGVEPGDSIVLERQSLLRGGQRVQPRPIK